MHLCRFAIHFVVILFSTASTAATPMVRRCAGKEADEGRQSLDALAVLVEKSDITAAKAGWKALSEHPCFKMAELESLRGPLFDDVDAMHWWWDRGGSDWLYSYLDDSPKDVVIPPDWPRVLRVEGEGAKHQAARLLCKTSQKECGQETAGWVLRTAEALERPTQEDDEPWTSETALAKCKADIKRVKIRANRYRAWRECLESVRPQTAMLPLARFEPPRDGWFVLRGRRGHYQFCDEVRAYDLATGAAYVAQSCSALVLSQGGIVNHDATDAARGFKVTMGRVPIDAIREAAWMTFFAKDVTDRVQTYAWYPPLPAGLEPVFPDDVTMHGHGLGSFWTSSAQTRLAWSWQGIDGLLGQQEHSLRASGKLTWPTSSNAGETHATQLLRVAEASLVAGCPPAKLPAQLVFGNTPGVSSLDATHDSLKAAERKLIDALMKPAAGCATFNHP